MDVAEGAARRGCGYHFKKLRGPQVQKTHIPFPIGTVNYNHNYAAVVSVKRNQFIHKFIVARVFKASRKKVLF